MESITFGVLTISDSCYQEPAKDSSGPRLMSLIRAAFTNAQVVASVLPDERDLIQRELRKWIDRSDVRVIITTGGTGFAPRDVTPEATKPLLDKECMQMSFAIALASLKKTKFAALSRGLCGIAGNTLVLNFPGSERAVVDCFEVVQELLPHALSLISDNVKLVQATHEAMQTETVASPRHVCPHKTGAGDANDRNSPYPMLPVLEALDIILQHVQRHTQLEQQLMNLQSPVHIPPFRASIKDGYAMKSTGFAGSKRVLGCIAAGDGIEPHPLQEDECFKINTGAPLPEHADCVVQVEDTKLLQRDKYGEESLVEILVEPTAGLDVRAIGHDMAAGDKVFPQFDASPVVINSLLAAVGIQQSVPKPKIAIISTGSELLAPGQPAQPDKIFDSNSSMLAALLQQFGFDCEQQHVLVDDLSSTTINLDKLFDAVDFVICSGGVSMGDKDFIKPALQHLQFKLHFGRVNMKPGKPFTFASKSDKYFFGLPGNPVSAFVTFHLFALPAIRWAAGWQRAQCSLPVVNVSLLNESLELDARPEYVRASVTSINGELYAIVTGDQISSRLKSIVRADVLVHLPARSAARTTVRAGEIFPASILRNDFISNYKVSPDAGNLRR
ncbi:molybdenum cofactor synthesis protein cinnamon [Drosophila busckii]|uniref:molybdenum cofactor synthesis protein cinnamon n=1 Tax=Drosophila busckii TaxID=30019 RepID=UPI00083ECEB5|nr:molybdenum cofactor synthesis protein cinnamon [Drosophila busckii]